MSSSFTAIFKVREKKEQEKKTDGKGAERVKKNDDDSIACQVSVGGGFFSFCIERRYYSI
jgi:hypothetical protein